MLHISENDFLDSIERKINARIGGYCISLEDTDVTKIKTICYHKCITRLTLEYTTNHLKSNVDKAKYEKVKIGYYIYISIFARLY